MSTSPVSGSQPAAPPPPAEAAAAPPAQDFSRVLARALERPYAGIAKVRSQIDAIRSGQALAPGATPPEPAAVSGFEDALPPAATSSLVALRQAAGSPGDPFGWRAMARQAGDEVVGTGFGWLFERQIQQESGFQPEVVFGFRRSSAGAEGIAQLMPEYYPGVDRTDPAQSLLAAATTMRHYLEVWDGDVRKALASYNAGLGRVRSLVDAHGEGWERGLPAETRQYLAAILGTPQQLVFEPAGAGPAEVAVFGGRGPGGVLTSPVDRVARSRDLGGLLELLGEAGSPVRAPADGRVAGIEGAGEALRVLLDHGNGWRTVLEGLDGASVAAGDAVRRGQPLGSLADTGLLRLAVSLDGRYLSPSRYLLPAAVSG